MVEETKEEIENERSESEQSESVESEVESSVSESSETSEGNDNTSEESDASDAEMSAASSDVSETSDASETSDVSEADEKSDAEEPDAEEPDADVSDEISSEEPAAGITADAHERETTELQRGDWVTLDVERPDGDDEVKGIAAFFDHPDHLMYAAEQTRDSDYESFDAYSPFPIHGMDDAMGLGRSWIPWVTFFAGATGFSIAASLEFGIMAFDWPMVFGGKPYVAWPSFVPILFELTVLLAGTTTAFVMFLAAGCFRKPFVIDKDITNDRFVLWISSEDEHFDQNGVIEFMKDLNPSEIRTVRGEG